MPKMKTHSGSKKRFKRTSKGKIIYKKPGARHLMTGQSSGETRRLRKKAELNKTDTKTMERFLPYA